MKVKIVEYKIVCEYSVPSLEYLVRCEIENGWQPYGDLVARKHNFYQPMVKYEDE